VSWSEDVVLESINIDGILLTPSKTWLLPVAQRKFELLNFCYAVQWEAFRCATISKQLFSYMTRPYRGDSGGYSPVLRMSILALCGC
jgi:hypothetical protein